MLKLLKFNIVTFEVRHLHLQLPVNFTAFCRNEKKYNQTNTQTALMVGYRVQPYIKYFKKKNTLQQLEALHLGSPDNAYTILLMDMILKLILGVTESLVKVVVTIRVVQAICSWALSQKN